MQELLTLARTLRPTALDDLGLYAALSALVDELGRKSGIDTGFEGTGDLTDVPMDVQLVTYRVAQEALSNAAQHSEADQIRVRVERDAEARRAQRDRRRQRIHLRAGHPWARDRRHARARASGRRRPRSRVPSGNRHKGSACCADKRRRWQRCSPHRGIEPSARMMRILIADDHGIVRSGLRMLLEGQDDMEVIGGGVRRRRGARPRDPRTPRPGDPRREDAQAHGPPGHPGDPRAGARRLGPDPLDVRRRALPVRGAQGRRLRLRAEGAGRHRPARCRPRGRARRAVPHPRGAARPDQGRARPDLAAARRS